MDSIWRESDCAVSKGVTMSKAVLTDSRQDLVDLVKRKNELAVSK